MTKITSIDQSFFKINMDQLNDLAGINLNKESFLTLLNDYILDKEEKISKHISIGFAIKKYPIVSDKIFEMLKSIKCGKMLKRIVADRQCVLDRKPSGWAKFPAMFYDDLTQVILELEKKHDFLRENNYIILKDKKLAYRF